MILETKKIADLLEADIQSLIDGEITEAKNIEYKRDLPGSSENQRKEFLADVSSFANASGGYLIYGVAEEKGMPVELV